MKTLLLFLSIISSISLTVLGNIVKNPDYELRLTGIIRPTRVERTPDATKISFHTKFRPHWWIKVDSTTMIIDHTTGKEYAPIGAENIVLNEEFYMPESGETDFTVIYPALPAESTTIDYICGDWKIYGLHIDGKKADKPAAIDPAQWERDHHKPYQGQPEEFFNRDTVTVSGRINGIDSRCGLTNMLFYYDNPINSTSKPIYVPLAADGTFSVSFPVESPGFFSASGLLNTWNRYYVEPGRDLELVIDWEDVLKCSQERYQGDYNSLTRTYFGGELGDINRQLADAPQPEHINVQTIGHDLTPTEAKARIDEVNNNYAKAVSQYIAGNDLDPVTEKILDITIKSQHATNILEYAMYRDDNSYSDATAPSLKEPVELSFYEPVKKLLAEDDVWTFAMQNKGLFNNRLAFSRLLQPLGVEQVTYAKFADPGFAFLKESGAELTPDEEAMAQSVNELIGKEGYKTQKELTQFFRYLMAAQTIAQRCGLTDKLKEYYNSLPYNEDSGDRISDRVYNALRQAQAIQRYAGTDRIPLLWQSAQIAKLCNYGNLKPSQYKQSEVTVILDEMKSTGTISDPDMLASLYSFYDDAYASMGYDLPDDDRGRIMRDIIAPHAGKYIMVDFWATTCGPCRANIESSAEMRERNREHSDFKMIFVTGDAESSEKAYNAYVAKNLVGEVSHRLPQADFDRLRNLFKFSSIPHYVLIDREGKVVFDDFNHLDLAKKLAEQNIILK